MKINNIFIKKKRLPSFLLCTKKTLIFLNYLNGKK